MQTEDIDLITSTLKRALAGDPLPQFGTPENEALRNAYSSVVASADMHRIGTATMKVFGEHMRDSLMADGADLQARMAVRRARFGLQGPTDA